MEPLDNIAHICKECAQAAKKAWHEHHPGLKLEIGDYIKTEIIVNEEGQIEHMWVRITKPDNKNDIIGILCNNSVLNNACKAGSLVRFTYEEIEDYVEQGDFENFVPWPILAYDMGLFDHTH